MSKYYTDAVFNKLKEQWYSKLKDEGFNDVEHGLESTPYLSGVRGTSTVIETARDGAAHSQLTYDRAVDTLDALQARQSVREYVANRCLGRLSTERWLACVYLAHNIPERTVATMLGRSRVWVRSISVPYREACIKYASGELWSAIAKDLRLAPILPSDFNTI